MKKLVSIIILLFLSKTLFSAQSDSAEIFNGSYWIGAITHEDANIPKGRHYFESEFKKPENRAAWDAVPELAKRSIYIRKKFLIDCKLKRATAYVCGLGFYEFSVNGKKVGDSQFAPLWSDYDKTVFYNSFDVTNLLKKGVNAVGILLGNGFYNVNGGRYTKLKISFGPPTLRFVLMLEYQNGTISKIVSDDSWKYDKSPITFNCIYGGEDYDARLEQKGWASSNFEDSSWKKVVLQQAPKGIMRAQYAMPVKIMETYNPVSIKKLTEQEVESASFRTKRKLDINSYIFDMGQNLSGFPLIKVRGKKGDTIVLVPGESLTQEGAVDQRQTGRAHFYTYTLKGDGEEVWHPRFSYYGFRYIQIEGARISKSLSRKISNGNNRDNKLLDTQNSNFPIIESVKSCFVYNSTPKVSTFECSSEIFNLTHRLIEKATRSNMQSVFTDCPHREKLGWLEQVHLNGPGLLFNYDLRSYGKQIMQNIADAQRNNGSMPTTAPEYVQFKGEGLDVFAESPEWGATLVIFPFMYRDFYQDDSLVREYYKNMCSYIDYLGRRADNGIISFGLGDWYDYGEYKAGFSRNTPVSLVATAHYYMMLDYIQQAAKLQGLTQDELKYKKLQEQVKEAFNSKFYNKNSHQYGTGSQCSNSLPLFLNMVPEEDKQLVLDNLVKDIKAHNLRLTTGDIGNRYLFQTLAKNGLDELMYSMHNHYDAPGYGFQIKFGATTLTEQWDPRKGSSWNHFMMGQIDEWFFKSLAGINIDYTGKVSISPKPVGDLSYVKASTVINYGKLSVSWQRKDGIFKIKVIIPDNTFAELLLPGETSKKILKSGINLFTMKY